MVYTCCLGSLFRASSQSGYCPSLRMSLVCFANYYYYKPSPVRCKLYFYSPFVKLALDPRVVQLGGDFYGRDLIQWRLSELMARHRIKGTELAEFLQVSNNAISNLRRASKCRVSTPIRSIC